MNARVSRLVSLLAVAFSAELASAQTPDLDLSWFSVAGGGGGGGSADGSIGLSGTIGQPAAGRIGDSTLAIQGGFGAISFLVSPPFEADVSPRPNGKNDGTVRLNDWIQLGRFVAGLDTTGSVSEFSRADCAPRLVNGALIGGDGLIDGTDVVQAGRYAAVLDPVTPMAGPTAPPTGITQQSLSSRAGSSLARQALSSNAKGRSVRLNGASMIAAETTFLRVELAAKGDENLVAFSLNFDTHALRFIALRPGADAGNAFLLTNTKTLGNGQIGVLLMLPAGQSFSAGYRALVEVGFRALSGATDTSTVLSFGDEPVAQQVVGLAADALTARFLPGTITISAPSGARSNPVLKAALMSGPSGGELQMSLSVAGPGQYSLEISADLVAWSYLRTLTVTGSTVDFAEPLDSRAPRSFYRVRLQSPP